MKKVLIFIRDISDCGGIQQTTALLVKGLSNNDYGVSVISLYHKYSKPFFDIGHNVNCIALFDHYVDTKRNFFEIKAVLHKQLSMYEHDYLIVQGMGYACYIPKKEWRSHKVIACEHTFYNQGQIGGLHWIGRELSLKKASAIITLTGMDAQNYNARKRNKCIIKSIPNSYEESLSTMNIPIYNIDSKTIVSCGTLASIKRFDHAIKAASIVFSEYKDWIWEIYGDGPEKNTLKTLIDEHGLGDKVILKGYEKNKDRIYKNKALFVLTSQFEGFGMVLVEAMQYGLPIVTYDVNYGPKEIVGSNVGIVVKDGNISELAERIVFLIKDKELRNSLSLNASVECEKYSPANITRLWIELLLQIEGIVK